MKVSKTIQEMTQQASSTNVGCKRRIAIRRVATGVLIVAGGFVLHGTLAQQPNGVTRTDLQRHNLSVVGREVVQARIDIAPGVIAPDHSHPGEEIIYMIEGSLEYRIEGEPPVTLKAGEVLFIPAGAIHSAKNVGSDNAAELATYIVEKDKPLLKWVKF